MDERAALVRWLREGADVARREGTVDGYLQIGLFEDCAAIAAATLPRAAAPSVRFAVAGHVQAWAVAFELQARARPSALWPLYARTARAIARCIVLGVHADG